MTVYYQNINDIGMSLNPATVPERYMLFSGGNSRATLYLMRGTPGDENFRYFPISVEGQTHLQTDGTTAAQWGYGFWTSARRDGKYIIVTDNVNSTSPFPFRPFKKSSEGQGYYYQYLGDGAIEPPAGNAQWRYAEYNPVYNEIICSVTGLIYIDNDDDTFTRFTGTRFDVSPLGSGNRTRRGNLFSPDGEMWFSNYSGGSSLQIYNRSGTGARYQLAQAITGIGSTNSSPIVYDPVRNHILVAVNDATKTVKSFGFDGASWVLQEDLAVNNPTWNGSGSNQIDNTFEHLYITEDGEYLIVTSGRSSGDGHFIFNRAGGQWTLTTTKLANIPNTITGQGLGFGQIPGTEVVYAGRSTVNITFMNIDGGSFTEVANSKRPVFGPVQRTAKGFTAGSTQTFEIAGNNIVTNPYDPIFLPRLPYLYQSLDYHGNVLSPGTTSTSDTSVGVLVHHPMGSHVAESVARAFSTNGPGPATGAIFNQPGPIPGSFSMVAGPLTYLMATSADPDSYIQNNITTGSLVAVIKTPSAWWIDSDDINQPPDRADGRHIFSYGNSFVSGASNHIHRISLVTDGTVGKVALFHRASSGDANAGKYFSNVNLALDTWYVIVVNQHADGNGPILWLNGVEQATTVILGTNRNLWLASATSQKTFAIGNSTAETAASRKTIEGMSIAAVGVYETPLSGASILQLAESFGVS